MWVIKLYKFLYSYLPYRCCIPNLVKIGPAVLEKTTDANSITIGHLTDSDNLK